MSPQLNINENQAYNGTSDPNSMFNTASPQSPLFSRYCSRRHSFKIREKDLPVERNARGLCTPAGLFFASVKLTVPLAYFYIAGYVIRDIAIKTDTIHYLHRVPVLSQFLTRIGKFPKIVYIWAIIEAIFYVCLILHIQWLKRLCPLEASLSSGPMQELEERQQLFDRIMDAEKDDPVSFVSGWFFDVPLESISRYDMLDFITWCLFEGRNQEHLTEAESEQLQGFLKDIEWHLSVHLYGFKSEAETHAIADDHNSSRDGEGTCFGERLPAIGPDGRPLLVTVTSTSQPRCPCQQFSFRICAHDSPPTFFTNLYEKYLHMFENYKHVLENERLQEFRQYMNEKKQQIYEAEESAMATASHMYEDLGKFVEKKKQQMYEAEESAIATASHMRDNAYFTLVDKGSSFDKRVSAFTQATTCQLTEAWNQVIGMGDRVETAQFIANRKKQLKQQLNGYRLLLDRTRSMSSSVPSKQMAELMRKITQVNDSLGEIEFGARDAFLKATGFAKNLLPMRKEPSRYAKYSYDPLLGVATYPLGFHLFMLSVTEGALRVLMNKRGFQRKTVGPISYYYHPGLSRDDVYEENKEDEEPIPVVFCHGIGIGLIVYLGLIDDLLALGRPILLPEIPYVTGFRAWQSPFSVLPPHVVASALSSMLANEGFLKATFIGHSYGTSWLSYMCKFAPQAISAVVFLDPICFCLHIPKLTQNFVYSRADPGSTSYMVRTDVIINYTIQRSFPWYYISLFTEQLPVRSVVFLSALDALVPVPQVRQYLQSKGARMSDYDPGVEQKLSGDDFMNVTMFGGVGHGDWIDCPTMIKSIVHAVDIVGRNDSSTVKVVER